MKIGRSILLLLVFSGLGATGWAVYQRLQVTSDDAPKQERQTKPVPVEVTAVVSERIELIRTFTGTLNAHREFVVAPKVGGRIEQINVSLSDPVTRGQLVAKLDDAEVQQALTQAEADLAVARAKYAEAQSLLEVARRELTRMEKLKNRGVSSESEQDTAIANSLVREAHLQVTKAQVTRSVSEVESAKIRLNYTNISAAWQGDSDQRIVAERFVDEGESVSANQPLLRIIELDKLVAVFFVTERDYGLLQLGQKVKLQTDAYPTETFHADLVRIAPAFNETTRQARVELQVSNQDLRLKPGMFVQANVVLNSADDATVVPESALTTRDSQFGVFVLNTDKTSVRWQPVQPGIKQGRKIQVLELEDAREVVTLGQQLLDDGSAVIVYQE